MTETRRPASMFAVCLLLAMTSLPMPADESRPVFDYCQPWMERFYRRPIVSLADDRALADAWLLPGGTQGLENQLATLLADILVTRVDKAHLWGGLPPQATLDRAAALKGAPLDEAETTAILALLEAETESFLKTHDRYFGMDFLKSAAALNLQSTIGRNSSLPEALQALARQHHLRCDILTLDSPTEEQLLQFLREDCPLLLEQSRNGRWQLVFAAFRDNDGHLQLLANQPEKTTMAAWRDNADELFFLHPDLDMEKIARLRPQFPLDNDGRTARPH